MQHVAQHDPELRAARLGPGLQARGQRRAVRTQQPELDVVDASAVTEKGQRLVQNRPGRRRDELAEIAPVQLAPSEPENTSQRAIGLDQRSPGAQDQQEIGRKIPELAVQRLGTAPVQEERLESVLVERELALQFAAFGDIDRDAQDGGLVRDRLSEGDLRRLQQPQLAAAVGELLFRDELGAAALDHFQVVGEHGGHLVLVRMHGGVGPADQLLDGRAVRVRHRRVGQDEVALAVLGEDHVRDEIQHLAQVHLAVLQRLLAPLALDGDAGKMRHPFDEVDVVLAGPPWLAVVHGERTHQLAVGREDGLGPAGSQVVLQRQIAEVRPQRVGQRVLDENALTPVCCGAARAGAGADVDPVDGLVVVRRKAGGREMSQLPLLLVEPEDGAEHAFALPLHGEQQRVQDVL